MAYQRYQGYQYETSPRKLQPEYEITRRNTNTHTTKKKPNAIKTTRSSNTKTKKKTNSKVKLVLYIATGFVILFSISYRNSLITENFNEKEELKKNLSSIQKENEQLKVNVESSLNLNNIEQMAKTMLGMQKLDNNQKVYVSLPKKDYIETATEEVIIEEDLNIWQKIWKGLTETIK